MNLDPSKELFWSDLSSYSYDPETGTVLRFGKPTGFRNERGYVTLQRQIQGKVRVVYAHRLAWRLHYGVWPSELVDHRNGIPWDNRICNLRECDLNQNSQNAAIRVGKSGIRNVKFVSKDRLWLIIVRANGKTFNFSTPSKLSAVLAAPLIRRALHGEFDVAVSRLEAA